MTVKKINAKFNIGDTVSTHWGVQQGRSGFVTVLLNEHARYKATKYRLNTSGFRSFIGNDLISNRRVLTEKCSKHIHPLNF